jgi:hypothetical protein
MAINPVSFPTPQAYSGGVDFSPLANLGNVYRQGQQQAAQQQTLAQLGNDPNLNAQLMIRSGVPDLVTQGVKMQSEALDRAENIREFNKRQTILEAADRRASAEEARKKGDYDKADRDEAAAAAMMEKIFPKQPSSFPTPAAAPQGMPQGALQPGMPQAAPQGIPASAVPGGGPATMPGVGPMTPLAGLGAPPPATPAGLTQEQLALLAQNPVTRKYALDQAAAQQTRALEERKLSPGYIREAAAAQAEGEATAPKVAAVGSAVIRPATVGKEGPIWVNRPTSALSPEAVDLYAERLLMDGKLPTGMGRGAQGGEDIRSVMNRAAQMAADRGIDASKILANAAQQASTMSEARALGTRAAGFGVAEEAMKASLPLMLEASKNVPRTAFPAVNKLILEGRTQVGDTNVKQLLIAVDTAAKDYARTINPTGQTREGDINYARKLLSSADSPETLIAAAQQLSREAGVTRAAIEARKAALFGGNRGQPRQPAPAPTAAPKIDPGLEAEMRKRGIHPGG